MNEIEESAIRVRWWHWTSTRLGLDLSDAPQSGRGTKPRRVEYWCCEHTSTLAPIQFTFASGPIDGSIKQSLTHLDLATIFYLLTKCYNPDSFRSPPPPQLIPLSTVAVPAFSSAYPASDRVTLHRGTMAEVPKAQSDLAEMEGDSRTRLRGLTAQATLKYSVKDYNAAAELYSQATELQAEINGELSSENADLLYAYGRCLYHVAVKNSDVLGSKVTGEKREEDHRQRGSKKQAEQQTIDEANGQEKSIVEGAATKVVGERNGPVRPGEEANGGSKPYFQFAGDENFDTSSDDEDEEGAKADAEDAEDADEEDDFVNAYEVLDLARVLLLKKLVEVENSSGKGKEKCESHQVQRLKERLADTYDLQAEISLEGERFPNAVVDLRSALELKTGLFPQESSLVAEAHFKLSLALEFSSVTQQKSEKGVVNSETDAHVDEAMREEAAQEMKEAIASCRLRIRKEEAVLLAPSEANGDSGKPKVTKEDIADVKEMVKEMEQRVSDTA